MTAQKRARQRYLLQSHPRVPGFIFGASVANRCIAKNSSRRGAPVCSHTCCCRSREGASTPNEQQATSFQILWKLTVDIHATFSMPGSWIIPLVLAREKQHIWCSVDEYVYSIRGLKLCRALTASILYSKCDTHHISCSCFSFRAQSNNQVHQRHIAVYLLLHASSAWTYLNVSAKKLNAKTRVRPCIVNYGRSAAVLEQKRSFVAASYSTAFIAGGGRGRRMSDEGSSFLRGGMKA